MSRQVTALLALVLFAACAQASAKQACERLSALRLPNTTITIAESVAAGAFVPATPVAPPGGAPVSFKGLPAFCRVAATIKPTKDSDIRVEVWFPTEGWNGKFRGRGNGGFAGYINYPDIGIALQRGYAAASTDTGHASPQVTNASWALGHPEKVADFGYRAIHEMTRVAKATIKAFYGSGPRHSYFGSCSNGGRQALMEAQRFPQDYDGILAGAPANNWTHLFGKGLADAQATTLDQGAYIPASKIPAIARAVNAACDAQDGIADGILNDPRQCHFKPEVLLCKQGDSEVCLSAPQVATLKKLYAGPHDASGLEIFPGYLPGAEEGPSGWGAWITGPAPGGSLLMAFSGSYFSNMVYEKADWNYKVAVLDEAVHDSDAKLAKVLNATDPNLAAFKARGGKLILYHGWNDPAISAVNTINYYASVVSRMGARKAAAFTKLYMVPGMQHCGGGPGPDSFGQNGPAGNADPQHDVELALEQWVEQGIAPASIVATKYVDGDSKKGVQMTRPLCPYPQVAGWTGKGSTDDAANFACKAP
jgi:Tannase and feruloyl esterase